MKTIRLLGIGVVMSIIMSQYTWANPCMPIAQACMQQGYYKGGNKVGKGLVENCVMPIVANRMTLPNASFNETVKQQCHAMIIEKMKQQ